MVRRVKVVVVLLQFQSLKMLFYHLHVLREKFPQLCIRFSELINEEIKGATEFGGFEINERFCGGCLSVRVRHGSGHSHSPHHLDLPFFLFGSQTHCKHLSFLQIAFFIFLIK